jgi:hypothetical protein
MGAVTSSLRRCRRINNKQTYFWDIEAAITAPTAAPRVKSSVIRGKTFRRRFNITDSHRPRREYGP